MHPRVAWLSGVAAVATVPLSILCGRLSDQVQRRKPFLQGAAAASAVGLFMMAGFPEWAVAAWGYALFAICSAIFLALQSTYAMQLLPSARHRGRDLGVINLTNTLPAILAPGLAYAAFGAGGFRTLLVLLAGIVLMAAILTGFVREGSVSSK
ncbi:MAG: MFS transporter [Brevundimonas sp.]